jgi:hypothetical protein
MCFNTMSALKFLFHRALQVGGLHKQQIKAFDEEAVHPGERVPD